MCENNKYAISVPVEKQLGCAKVSDRAIGYGMPGYTIDGNDVLEVYRVVKKQEIVHPEEKGLLLLKLFQSV